MRIFRHLRSPLTILAGSFAVVAITTGTAVADKGWEKNKADCDETVFADPEKATLGKVVKCVYTWETHRKDLKKVKGDYRNNVVAAINRVYAYGDNEDMAVAERALKRLGVNELPERQVKARPALAKAPPRKKWVADPPTKPQIAAAEKHFKTGRGHAKKKKYAEALAAYQKMIDVAPGYAKGHYNVACMHALLGQEDKMVEALRNVNDIAAANPEDENAANMLRKTWANRPDMKPPFDERDEDFDGIRDTSAGFKEVTGYGKIQVVNEIPDDDSDNTDNLIDSLKKLSYAPEYAEKKRKEKRKYPVIMYAPHARSVAFVIHKIMNHPGTKAEAAYPEDLNGFDVVVYWSAEVKNGEVTTHVQSPKDAGKELDKLAREQDKILRQPEEAVDEMNAVLDKPGEVQDDIENVLQKPGQMLDRAGKTVDKLKNPLGK